MNDQAVEQKIQDLGLNAPRLTPQHIDSLIVSEQYYVFPGTTTTVCRLTLENGFGVTGESTCLSKENFNEELGREIAQANARDKIWMLEGYAFRQKQYEQTPDFLLKQ